MNRSEDLRDVFELGCPACGQADHLQIVIMTLARLTSYGSDPEDEHEWDDGSYCRCPECGHDGIVADFAFLDDWDDRLARTSSNEPDREWPDRRPGRRTRSRIGSSPNSPPTKSRRR